MIKVQESGENYLETIYLLKKKNGVVRSVDIAQELEYSKPSISRAMSILKESGHITMGKNGDITLTESGETIAKQIYERHMLLTEFLVSIGVSQKTAGEDACKIEHHISKESFEKLKAHILGENK